jgi:hypothetical protein
LKLGSDERGRDKVARKGKRGGGRRIKEGGRRRGVRKSWERGKK